MKVKVTKYHIADRSARNAVESAICSQTHEFYAVTNGWAKLGSCEIKLPWYAANVACAHEQGREIEPFEFEIDLNMRGDVYYA